MYTLSGYGEMIADRVRVDAYTLALHNALRPGSVVVEIGTGPGFFALLACQLGASRVYAIEPDDIIQVAREIASANGCADRIEFIQDLSTRVTLPVRADVVISDMRGILPLFGRHIPDIADARRRFLALGGTLIPRKDSLWAAVVEAPETYAAIVNPWEQNAARLDLSPARRLAVNGAPKTRAIPKQLLTRPQLWATLDYATVENPDVHGKLQWTVERPGTGHGIIVWFDAELAEGVGFSNAPGSLSIYGSLFFPWTQPVALAPGDAVSANFTAKLVADDYVWRWTTRADRVGVPPVEFDQSSLQGAVLSPETMRKGASDHLPQLSEEGVLDRRILALMDGRANLEEIARKLASEFPSRFTTWQEALSSASVLSRKYSR